MKVLTTGLVVGTTTDIAASLVRNITLKYLHLLPLFFFDFLSLAFGTREALVHRQVSRSAVVFVASILFTLTVSRRGYGIFHHTNVHLLILQVDELINTSLLGVVQAKRRVQRHCIKLLSPFLSSLCSR